MDLLLICALAIGIGIFGYGIWCAFMLRSEPAKAFNILLLTLGLALLGFGVAWWLARRESPQVKAATSLQFIVPGWALVTMGYLGLQHSRGKDGDDDSRPSG